MHRTILLVDDDDGFQTLLEWAIRSGHVNASLQWVWNGEMAISYLSREGRFKDETAFPNPDLVLLDLNMPRLDGFEVLQWKSSRPGLSQTPFVVLSSSDLERDKKKASELGARHYFVKPLDLPGLMEIFKTLNQFWNRSEAGQIFLRDSETGNFYKSPNGWVVNPEEATAFETQDHALHQRSSITKPKMEILVLDERGRPRSGLRLWTDGSIGDYS